MKDLKVVVLSTSGGVGKSTIAQHLLPPRMPGAKLFTLETFNDAAEFQETEKDSAKYFSAFFHKVLDVPSAIVDIGVSNIADALNGLASMRGAHREFDYFIIPVTPELKQQNDTRNTLATLASHGIEPDRIRVIFNKVESGDVEREFSRVLEYLRTNPVAKFSTGCAIAKTELFDSLAGLKVGIPELLATDEKVYRDARKAAAETGDEKARKRANALLIAKMQAEVVNENFDDVFGELKL